MLEVKTRKKREINNIYRAENALFLEQEAGTIRLIPQTSDIIRISYTENGLFSTEQGKELEDLSDGCIWEYTESGRDICVLTDSLAVRIDRLSASIRYERRDGELLLQEALQESKTVEEFDKNFYHTKLALEFGGEERLFGLGQGEEGVWNLRHTTQYLHQANLKISIPLLISSNGYGILLSTQSPAIFDDTQYGSYLYTEADAYLDYFFLAGNMEEIIRGFRRLTGRAAMLPKWIFGYLQSQERYETQEEIISTAEKFRDIKFPLDGIVLDWMSWKGDLWGQKTFDEERFPDPAEMIRTLHEMDVHFMLSLWPCMDTASADYCEFEEAGLLLPNSNIYNAFCGESRRMYWNQVERGLFCYGVDAWWADASEPVTPEWERMKKPPAGEMYRNFVEEAQKVMPVQKANAFGFYHAGTLYEGQRSVTNEKRTVILTRNGYAGSQKYGTILWSGDIYASWETLKKQIVAGLQFCASGLPYWTLDIGAFFVKKGEPWYWNGEYENGIEDMGYRELYVRWFQYGAFLPVFRSHGTDCRREPWNFGEKGEPFYDALCSAGRLRYRLLPYIYSLAGAVWKNDIIMMRPLIYDFPEDKRTAGISGQYMFGPAIMVCPVTEPVCYHKNSVPVSSPRKQMAVYLPKGTVWYDFYTNERYPGGEEIMAEVCLDKIPVYVRGGAIIPTMEPVESTARMDGNEICLLVYAGEDGQFELYEDAGDGYGYEQGEYCVTSITFRDQEQSVEWRTEGNSKYRRGEISYKIIKDKEK